MIRLLRAPARNSHVLSCDQFLLSSDGLLDTVTNKELELTTSDESDPEETVSRLLSTGTDRAD